MKKPTLIIIIIFATIVSLSPNSKKKKCAIMDSPKKLPIIYTDNYNIRLFGIQKLHPFDSEKYHKVYNYLVKKVKIDNDSFFKPELVTDKYLLRVHTKEYIDSLNESKNIAKIAELGLLSIFPNFILQEKILKPMKYAVGGTILGAELAMKNRWAINLSGGYHHAKSNRGEGFCFYADIPLAVYKLWEKNRSLRVLIIDLDAHQGNGLESIFKNDKRVFILDVYNKDIYPDDHLVKKYIDFNLPIDSFLSDKQYLKLIKSAIPGAIARSKPNLIIYNAGTDILSGDPLGALSITEDGIIKRDEIVFKNAIKRNIPILMVLSGGYNKKSGHIIGSSIENILKNVLKIIF